MKKNDKLFNKAVEKLRQVSIKAGEAMLEIPAACDDLKAIASNSAADLDRMTTVTEESIENAIKQLEEEWIWVKGYKGTDRDMKCRDYQFMFNYRHDMVDGSEIKVCESGFHFCPKLKDVFGYYEIKDGHRFFEVRALVRKKDYEVLKPSTNTATLKIDGMGVIWPTWANPWTLGNDKLTSKAIEFVRELTLDEIFADTEASGWSDEDKKLALEIGVGEATKVRQVTELEALGYSEELSEYIVHEIHKYNLAKFLTTLPENPSMDTKMIILFGAEDDCSKYFLEKEFVTPYTKYKKVALTKDDIISPAN